MSETVDFTMSWKPNKGKATITVEHDGDAIHIDTLDPTSASARSRYIKATTEKGCDPEQVEADLLTVAGEFESSTTKAPADSPQASSMDLLNLMDDGVVNEARQALKDADLIQLIVDDVKAIGITGEEFNVLLLYFVGTSRLLERPANVIVQGSSASGKSYMIDKVSELFPPECKIVASAMTPQALHHMEPGSLRHKFVVAGERSRLENDDRAEATRALREMLSGGRLSKLMPSKSGGEIVTKLIEQDGPIAYVESTTLTHIFDEDLNRCLLVHPDETSEQTKRILVTETSFDEDQREDVRQRHYAMQRLLRRFAVKVPYQRSLAELMPHDKVETRRLFPMLLAIVRASALLHQWRREDLGDGVLVATEDDYATAYQLLRKPISEALAGTVSDAVQSYFDWLKSANVPERFCVADILNCNDNPKGESQTYAIVKELHKANYLITVEGNHRGKHYQINDDPVVGDVLPTPEKLFGGWEPEKRKIA